jgi:hypothetical protein
MCWQSLFILVMAARGWSVLVMCLLAWRLARRMLALVTYGGALP